MGWTMDLRRDKDKKLPNIPKRKPMKIRPDDARQVVLKYLGDTPRRGIAVLKLDSDSDPALTLSESVLTLSKVQICSI
jgi:S1-C subfamily serine protease